MLDSGATSHMIMDESLFIEIDKEYTGIISNANSSTSSIEGRGTIKKTIEDSKGCEGKIRLSITLLLPDNSENLVSVSKLRAADNRFLLGKDLEIRTKNGTFFPFEERT